jgi:anti-sigma factor RsiW
MTPTDCERLKLLMMRVLDQVASSSEAEELEAHVARCESCNAEWRDFRATKHATDRMRDNLQFDGVLDQLEQGMAARLQRWTATALVGAGFLVVVLYGLASLIFSGEDVPTAIRVGSALFGAGFLIFLWETLRWKMRTHPHDPYRDVLR